MSVKIFRLIIFCIALLADVCFLLGQTPVNDPHWELQWEDNFNTFDANKWVAANYQVHGGEPQLYVPYNVFTSGGNLVIVASNVPTVCPSGANQTVYGCSMGTAGQTYFYTSGLVETTAAYNTQFGYVEARINVPYGYGFWPAFWTWRGNGGVTTVNETEIDIFEMLGRNSPTIMGTNMHTKYCPCNLGPCENCDIMGVPLCTWYDSNIKCNGINITMPSYANTFHTYAIEWSPTSIIWYVDGNVVRNSSNIGIVSPATIIFNLAMEPGYPPNSSTPFPSQMFVDYIRVYKLKNDCNTVINSCSYNLSTHDSKIKKSISVGGGCFNTLSSGQNVTFRATDYIELKDDFYIPLGASFYGSVDPCY